MSLLQSSMVELTMIDKRTVSDGRGGTNIVWTPGAKFQGAISFDNSTQARIGEAQGVKNLYTVTTSRSVSLQFRDVFVRDDDGKVFRVTSDGDENKTPRSAGLDIRQVSAEQWVIPEGL